MAVVAGRSVSLRLLAWGLLILYSLVLALIVFWPHHVDDNSSGRTLSQLIGWGHSAGWLPGWFNYSLVEWLANVVMFVPGGFLLSLLLSAPCSYWVPLGAVVTSCGIEGIQYFMPDRTGSLADIAANSLGAFLGWALVALPRAVRRISRQRVK